MSSVVKLISFFLQILPHCFPFLDHHLPRLSTQRLPITQTCFTSDHLMKTFSIFSFSRVTSAFFLAVFHLPKSLSLNHPPLQITIPEGCLHVPRLVQPVGIQCRHSLSSLEPSTLPVKAKTNNIY